MPKQLPKVPNYFKNVLKSIAYTAADVTKDMMPDAAEFARSNKDFVKQTYSSIKMPKMDSRRRMSGFQDNKVFQNLDYGVKNFFNDLKTGDFYAKEREDKDLAKMAGFDMGDWDDLSEFGVSDNWEQELKDIESGKSSSTSKSNTVTAGDMKITSAIEGTAAASTQATVNAIIATNRAQTKNIRANTAMLFEQNERLFSGVHKDMSAIGSTIEAIFKMQTAVLGNIDKNISSYQTESLRLENERNAMLKELLEMERNRYKTAQEREMENARNRSSKRKRFSDLSIGGIADLDSYFQNVKDNIKGELGSLTGGLDIGDMIGTMAVTPTRDLAKFLMKKAIPTAMKSVMEDFNNTIGGVFGNLMGMLANTAKNDWGPAGILAKIFGVNTKVNREIDTANYEKGAVAWDGIAKRALTNVIPGYLRRIEAHLTGNNEIDYNYDSGKWVTLSSQSAEFKKIKKGAYQGATNELIQNMNSTLNYNAPSGAKANQEYQLAIDEFRQFLYDNNGQFKPHESAAFNGVDRNNYPHFFKYYARIIKSYNDFDIVDKLDNNGNVVGKRHTKYGVRMQVANKVLQQKDYEEKRYREIEANGTSSYTKLNEYTDKIKVDQKTGKGIPSLFTYKDSYGHTIHSYLHNINSELLFWRVNYGDYGFGGGAPSGSGARKPRVSFSNLSKDLTTREYRQANKAKKKAAARSKGSSYNPSSYKADVLKAISEGRLDDLRGINSSEGREYAFNLSRIDKESLRREYMKEVGEGYDEATFNNFFNKQFRQAHIRSMDDLNEAIEKANTSMGQKHTYDALSKEEKGILGKLLAKAGGGPEALRKITQAPAEAFSDIMYAADRSVYEMFFKHKIKKNGEEYKGFLDMMVGETTEIFKKLGDTVKTNIIEPLMKKLGIDDDFKKRFKDELKSVAKGVGGTVINANKEVFGGMFNAAKEATYNGVVGRATTKMTTEEFSQLSPEDKKKYRDSILRAQYSKNVKDASTRATQVGFSGDIQAKAQKLVSMGLNASHINRALMYAKSDEEANAILDKMYNRWDIANHAKGTGEPYMGNTMLSAGEMLFNDDGVSVVKSTGAYKVNKPTHILNSGESFDLMKALGLSPVTKTKHSKQHDEAQENIEKRKLFPNHAEGTVEAKGGTEKIKKIFNHAATAKDAKSFIEESKKNIPEMLAGGAIGGGTSLVFGLIGGPLLGAAVGASASLIKRSTTMQRILFGEMGEDGQRKDNGIISKKVQDVFTKTIPKYGKYGIAGATASLLLPFGPIAGAILGTSIGVLKENDEMREKLFGKLGIGKSEKNIIKKMLPGAGKGAAIGAIATLFGGPFGLAGNAIVGAALGMATSTDEFKELVLGKTVNGVRSGGILGVVREAFSPLKKGLQNLGDKIKDSVDKNIIQPLADFIQPMIHAIPQVLGAIPRAINDRISTAFKNSQNVILRTILKPFQKLGNGITKMAGSIFNIATTPFRLLGGIGNKVREKQMKTMNADYMTAEERINWSVSHGKAIDKSDEWFRDLSMDEAKNIRGNLSSIIDTQDSLKSARKTKNKEIEKTLDNYRTADGKRISTQARRAIKKAINQGHADQIPKILSEYSLEGSDTGMTDDQIKTLMGGETKLGRSISQFQDLAEREKKSRYLTEEDRKTARDKASEYLKKAGLEGKLDLTKRSDIEKFIRYLDTEVDARGGENPEEEHEKLFKGNAENIQTITDYLKEIAVNGIKLANWGDAQTNNDDIARQAAMDKAMGEVEGRADANQARVKEAYKNKYSGDTNIYDELTPEQKQRVRGGRKGIDKVIHKAPKSIRKVAAFLQLKGTWNGNTIPIKFTKEAKNYIDNNISDVVYKGLLKFFKNKPIGYIIALGKPVTVEDLQYYRKLYTKQKLVSRKCKFVLDCHAEDEYNTIRKVVNMTGMAEARMKAEYEQGKGSIKVDVLDKNGNVILNADSTTPQPKANPNVIALPGPTAEVQEKVDNNFLGTLVKGAVGVGKAVVGGVKSLFGGGEESGGAASGIADKVKGAAASALNTAKGAAGKIIGGGLKDSDEVDVPGDGRDVAAIGNGFGLIKRKSDGSIEPDTSDSHTKQLVTEQNQKETLMNKLQNAQLKASEALSKAFGDGDDDSVKTKKKGLGWIAALLLGGLLLKSGILQKLWKNIMVPLWKNHVKPFLTEKVWPWAKEKVLKPAGDWIMNTALPAIGDLMGKAIGGLIDALPSIIAGAFKLGGGILDGLTGNKTNVGGSTTVDAKDKSGETGMLNEKGEKLTWENIQNGNYKQIYNAQHVQGTTNEDGTVTFKDQSLPGSSYAITEGNAMAHAFTNPIAGKVAGKIIEVTGKAAGKVGKLGGIGGRVIGKTMELSSKAFAKPIQTASKWGSKFQKHVSSVLNKNVAERTGQAAATEAAEAAAKKATGEAAKNAGSGAVEKVVGDVVDTATGDVIVSAAEQKGTALVTAETAKKMVTEDALKAAKASAGAATEEAAEKATGKAAKSAASKVVSEAGESAAEAVAEGAAKATASGATTAGEAAAKAATSGEAEGLMAKIMKKAKELIQEFLEKPKVAAKLEKAAEKLGVKKAATWIKGIKSAIQNSFDDMLSKAASKIGTDTVEYVAKHIGVIVTVVMAVKDFLVGCDQAESILGVEETNIADELVCGLVNALSNLLIIPAIWPGVPKVTQLIYKLFKKDISARQESAKKNYEAYVAETGSTLTEEEWLKRKYSFTGKVGGWFSDRWQDIKNGFKAIGGGIKKAGKGIAKGAKSIGKGVKNAATSVGGWFSDRTSDVANFFTGGKKDKAKKNKDNDKELDVAISADAEKAGMGNMLTNMGNVLNFIPNQIKDYAGKFTEKLGGIFGKKTSEEDKDKTANEIDNGKLSVFSKEYWSKYNNNDNSLSGILGNVAGGLNRLMFAPLYIVKGAAKSLSSGITNIGGWIGDTFGGFADFFNNPLDFIYKKITGKDKNGNGYGNQSNYINQDGIVLATGESASTSARQAALNKQYATSYANAAPYDNRKASEKNTTKNDKSKGNFFTRAWGGIKKLFGFGPGPEYYKQNDPTIANVRFNSGLDSEYQTIGDSGCGPASAVNAVNYAYGRGPSEVVNAANYALARGYKETDGGTKPGFFTDYFAKNGLSSDITYNRNQMINQINSGNPTVLMGRDPRGVSNSTPYGRVPHYVTVTGTDGNGHAIVQDPESRYDNQLYSINDLVGKSSMGISAFGKNYRGKYGKGEETTSIGGFLSNVIANSAAAQVLNSFLDMGGSSSSSSSSGSDSSNVTTVSSDGSTSSSDSTTSTTGTTTSGEKFSGKKYKLNDKQILQLAHAFQNEQSGDEGIASEASLAANILETNSNYSKKYKSDIVKFMQNAGWFASSTRKAAKNSSASGIDKDSYLDVIKDVLVNGNRVFPQKVNEHDSLSDITSVTLNGSSVSKSSKSSYVKDKTKIKNRYGSNYTFFAWANPSSQSGDPFGYTGGSGSGSNKFKPRSRFGSGRLNHMKYARGRFGLGNVKTLIMVGDSKTVGMHDSIYGGNDGPYTGKQDKDGNIWICKVGMGLSWMKGQASTIDKYAKSGTAVVINMGVNDFNDNNTTISSQYVSWINQHAKTWKSKGAVVYFISVPPLDSTYKSSYGTLSNDGIDKFNAAVSSGLSSDVNYLDINSQLKGKVKCVSDHLHYNSDTYKLVFQTIQQGVLGGVTSSASTASGNASDGSTTSGSTSSGSSDSRNMLLVHVDYADKPWQNNGSFLTLNNNSSSTSTADTSSSESTDTSATGVFGRGLGSAYMKPRSRYGRGMVDSGTAQQVWAYFKNKGFNPAGIAGILGNMANESGVEPRRLQGDFSSGYSKSIEYTNEVDSGAISKDDFVKRGPNGGGYGIVQFTYSGYKKSLYENAKNNNKSIGDLGIQLDTLYSQMGGIMDKMKTQTDPTKAASIFLREYEKPADIPGTEPGRQQDAVSYFNKYSGQNFTWTGETNSITGGDGSSDSGAAADNGLSSIGQWLSTVIANSPAAQVLNSFLDFGDGGGSSSSGGSSTGSTSDSGDGVSASGDAASVVKIAQHEADVGDGSNKENPMGSNHVKYNTWYYGKQSSEPWCAAFVSYVGNKAGVSTDVIPKDAYTVTAYQKITQNGSKPSNNDAKPGDIIYFTKNGSPSGIYHTGIVEKATGGQIYTIEGNSSDRVARRSYAMTSSKVLLARPKYANTSGDTVSFATPTANSSTTSMGDAPDYENTRGGNGIKPISKFGRFRDSIYGRGSVKHVEHLDTTTMRLKDNNGYHKVEYSGWDKKAGNAIRSKFGKGGEVRYGMVGGLDYTELIKQIVQILLQVASNTDKLNVIVSILNEKLGISISAQDVANAQKGNSSSEKLAAAIANSNSASTSNLNTYADTIGASSVNSIINAMNAIASE